MLMVKTGLLQRIAAFSGTFVTFLSLSGALSPVAAGMPLPHETGSSSGIPAAIGSETGVPTLNLISPYDELNLRASAPPVDSDDLLAKLRNGFALQPVMNNRVQAELNWFVKHPDYLDRVFTRAQRYLPYITDELESRGLPLELALLPIVESAYDPFAYSHGRAAGLWQIIPGTASRFGIHQNWWYDGRRDVVDSTRGALDYLEYLHELMDGDWLHAIASYNSGEGNVRRAVRRQRQEKQAD